MNLTALSDFIAREWRTFIAEATRPHAAVDVETEKARRETHLIQVASEGSAARQFLESEQVVTFMARSEAKLTHEMLSLPLDADAARRDLAVAIQTQRQLMKFLTAQASDGRAAERELERLRSGRRDYF